MIGCGACFVGHAGIGAHYFGDGIIRLLNRVSLRIQHRDIQTHIGIRVARGILHIAFYHDHIDEIWVPIRSHRKLACETACIHRVNHKNKEFTRRQRTAKDQHSRISANALYTHRRCLNYNFTPEVTQRNDNYFYDRSRHLNP